MQDVVAELRVGVKDLAAEDRDGWSGLAWSDRLRDVAGLRDSLEIEAIRTVAGWDRHAAWAEDGAVTAISWLKHHLGMTMGDASWIVRLARHYDRHPSVAAALDGGDIGLPALRLLCRAEKGREDLFAICLPGLLQGAKTLGLGELSVLLAEWADAIDDEEPPDPADRSWKGTGSSGLGRGELNTSEENLAIIQAAIAALDTLDPPDCPEGPRTQAQRWHDIVIDIFRRALADKLGDDPAAVTNVDLILDADLAAELLSGPKEREELFDGDPLPEVLRPFRDGETDRILRRCQRPDGTRAKRVIAEAMLCFSFLRRILLNPATGAPIDVGRAYRRFTPKQLRALVIRDGGCMFPGCDRGPKWCDAHHLDEWEHGGATNLDNGLLLCRRHHHLIHSKGWNLQRDPRTGTVTVTTPDGRHFTRKPTQRR